jgi:hypothetical protein
LLGNPALGLHVGATGVISPPQVFRSPFNGSTFVNSSSSSQSTCGRSNATWSVVPTFSLRGNAREQVAARSAGCAGSTHASREDVSAVFNYPSSNFTVNRTGLHRMMVEWRFQYAVALYGDVGANTSYGGRSNSADAWMEVDEGAVLWCRGGSHMFWGHGWSLHFVGWSGDGAGLTYSRGGKGSYSFVSGTPQRIVDYARVWLKAGTPCFLAVSIGVDLRVITLGSTSAAGVSVQFGSSKTYAALAAWGVLT